MAAASWVSGASPESDFSIQNLPYGIFTAPGRTARVGVGIGDQALDLFELAQKGIFDGIDDFDARACFGSSTLNAFMGHNRPVWQKVRARLVGLLSEPPTDPVLKDDAALQQGVFVSLASITMCMPARIGECAAWRVKARITSEKILQKYGPCNQRCITYQILNTSRR